MEKSAEPSRGATPHVYTVTELTREIRDVLEESFPSVWVEGEISNLHIHSSGHMYLTLKDDKSQIRAVMFRMQVHQLPFEPEDGMYVLCLGRIGVYEARGEYQLYLDFIEPKGLGALVRALEQLKLRLATEGLFDEARKRPLPFLPRVIGIVTSPAGAVIRDMLRILGRRFPKVHVLVRPVRVQGEGAAQEIAQGIRDLNEWPGVDVIVVARGGGSLEDLWAFNEEEVARAIAASRVPVVSAVGHEVDYTISDFVADMRAPTPSAAAELIVPVHCELHRLLEELRGRLLTGIWRVIRELKAQVNSLIKRPPDFKRRVAQERLILDELQARMSRAIKLKNSFHRHTVEILADSLRRLDPRFRVAFMKREVEGSLWRLEESIGSLLRIRRSSLQEQAAVLQSLSPLRVLARGYSIVRRTADGKVVTDASDIKKGDLLDVKFHKGRAACLVDEVQS